MDPDQIELPDELIVALMRTKSSSERLAMAFASHRLVRLRLAGHFQTLHPEWTDEEIQQAIARRFLSGAI